MHRLRVVAGVAAVLACADGFAPNAPVRLSIIPVFSEAAAEVLTGDLDRLGIRIKRLPSLAVVVDTTVAVDTAGNADANLAIPLTAASEDFEIRLQGLRSTDTPPTVLYEGFDTVTITGGATTPPTVEVPVAYVGPCAPTSGCNLSVAPQDSLLTQGDSVALRFTVDSLGVIKSGVPVTLRSLDPALVVFSGARAKALTGTTGGIARVLAKIPSDSDTVRIVVLGSAVPPAKVVVVPGYAALRLTAPNNTVQLTDTVKDAFGNILSPSLATFTSRNPAVATVTSAGLVTAMGPGLVTIVASAGTVGDSLVVIVGDPAAPGDVAVFAAAGARTFAETKVGQPVRVDVAIDQVAAGSFMGSYKARFTWSPTVLRYDSTAAGDYPAPTVNPDTAATGVLVFAAVDANGALGRRVLARLWFTALTPGPGNHLLQILEMSGVSPTFTNYWQLGRYLISSGAARITP